jgi:hypothetical protein
MASSIDENPKETQNSDEIMIDEDDVTVVSGTKTTETDYIEQEMNETVLRFEIPYRNGQADDADTKLHAQLLQLLTTAYDETELRIFNNKNKRITDFQEEKWQNNEYYKSHFGTHVDTSGRKTVVAHRIRSTKNIGTIKGEPTIIRFLKQTNTYIRAHYWKEDELDIKDIGFLLTYVPTKHSKEYVTNDMFERAALNTNVDWASAPPFHLIHAQPKIKIAGKPHPLRTHAYSVQVKTQDAAKMNKFLRMLYDQDPLYMPYSMKKKLPKVVAKAILQQNHLIANLFVIVLIGISRDVMTALKDNLNRDVQGFIGVSDTNQTDQRGRWRVLVQEKTFKKTRKYITANLDTWLSQIPTDTHDTTPSNYPPPQVHQKYSDDDDDSSGQASYMSSCAQSYGSFNEGDETDETYFIPQESTNHNSYANVARQAIHNEGLSGKEIQFKATELELRSIIATLQKEVNELKGAQTPSTVTAETTTPSSETVQLTTRMEQFEDSVTTMMNRMSDMLEGNDSKQKALDYSDASHRDKRVDNRTTPDRHPPARQEPRELYLDNGDGSKFSVGYAAMPGQLGYRKVQILQEDEYPHHGHPYRHTRQQQLQQQRHQEQQEQLRQQQQYEQQQQHNHTRGPPSTPSMTPGAILTSPPRLLAEGARQYDV